MEQNWTLIYTLHDSYERVIAHRFVKKNNSICAGNDTRGTPDFYVGSIQLRFYTGVLFSI